MTHPHPDSFTVAFYNTENLFDFRDDPLILDEGYLPIARKRWDGIRYAKKISRIGEAISRIGFEELQKPPALIGLAEVENKRVLQDLVECDFIKDIGCRFVHYDSPDERGIDVALLYNPKLFNLIHSKSYPLNVENEAGVKDYTRDILYVCGTIGSEKLHILVNHWPSRHVKTDTTGHKRMFATSRIVLLLEEIRREDPNAQVIVMGDFNDTPRNNSMQVLKNSGNLFNPMEALMSFKRGSTIHNSKWLLFDQILLTDNFVNPNHQGLGFVKAEIFDDTFLTQNYGKYKGEPWRTYASNKYIGGYSDHFPVYVQLKNRS